MLYLIYKFRKYYEKKNVLVLALVFVSLLCMNYSCVIDYVDRRILEIENKSSSPIYGFYSMDDSFRKVDRRRINRGLLDSFNIDITGCLSYRPVSWDNIKRDSKDNHIRIFIVSQDLVDRLGWKKIMDETIYSKVYKLNMDSIEARKWTIVYE